MLAFYRGGRQCKGTEKSPDWELLTVSSSLVSLPGQVASSPCFSPPSLLRPKGDGNCHLPTSSIKLGVMYTQESVPVVEILVVGQCNDKF